MTQITLRGLIYSRYKTVGDFAEGIGWTRGKANRAVRAGVTRMADLLELAAHFGVHPKTMNDIITEEHNPGRADFYILPGYRVLPPGFVAPGLPPIGSDRLSLIEADIRFALRRMGLRGDEPMGFRAIRGDSIFAVTVEGVYYGNWNAERRKFE